MFRSLSLITFLGSYLLLVGCNVGDGLQAVTGAVTMNGSPLEGATVVFAPSEGDRGNALGATNEAGKYELKYGRNAGVLPGKYIVLIHKSEITETDEREAIPAQYNQHSTLEAVVLPGEPNVFNFDLKSK